MTRVTILDYGMGNLRSVQKAIQRVGGEALISTEVPKEGRLIIPGVGAFGAAMECIEPKREAILRFANANLPLLGICLGQQLLFDSSEELVSRPASQRSTLSGEHRGLGLIPGRVRYFRPDLGLKVPHVGWNEVRFKSEEGLGSEIEKGSSCYFVHSLITECAEPNDILATTEYGETFASAVRRGNVWGTQFHPEKSGEVGLKMLENFLKC
ncbi:imidazole glycerol phosphate synthase subunit HisH [soil metagenome]